MGLLTRNDGLVARAPEEQQHLLNAGYQQCHGEKEVQQQGTKVKIPCPFFISPEGQEHIARAMGGYYTCPVCYTSWDLLQTLPQGFNLQDAEENMRREGVPGEGGTVSGRSRADHAQTGEDVVEQLGQIPGYGPLTWVHGGGAVSNSPLDMATAEWGVEVKTIDYGAKHHRFIGGHKDRLREDGTTYNELVAKMEQAAAEGKKGVLGVLVLLDYRRSVADIYVKEFPLDKGKIGHFRSGDGNVSHLVAEVPFKNPYMDPSDPAPHGPSTFPQSGSAFQDEPKPF